MSTHVYIDGFNLYFGCLRDTPYRWLDLVALCRRLLPPDQRPSLIHYFTARITSRPDNPSAPTRQQMCLRALSTLAPTVAIHYGRFQDTQVMARLVTPLTDGTKYVRVHKTEEKGSDVNLASHLLREAFTGACTTAVVVSNDSDLATPLRMAREDCGLTVGVINPHYPRNPSYALAQHADFVRPIHDRFLRSSQFPDRLADRHGSFSKPAGW
jgi:uncharacterized LabA/DUF88 family protein